MYAVGHFFRKSACSLGFLRVPADFDAQREPPKTPVFCLSGPFFSPVSLFNRGSKSAKAPVWGHKNQQLTRGRIKQLFLGIGRGRKPPRFGEWRMQLSSCIERPISATSGTSRPAQRTAGQNLTGAPDRAMPTYHSNCAGGGRITDLSAWLDTIPLCSKRTSAFGSRRSASAKNSRAATSAP